MSDKITIKEVIGDGFDFLKSSETHDDLKNQMLEAYSNSTEYIEEPIVVYEDSQGEIWELVISIDVVKQPPEHYEGEILLTKKNAKKYVKANTAMSLSVMVFLIYGLYSLSKTE